MEAEHALKAPPPWLERLVLSLIPPAARETVAGDLCELYRSPLNYVVSAARVVPFVMASQVRRNLNVPALLVQGFIVFFCCTSLLITEGDRAAMGHAAALTAAVLSALLIFNAYQGDAPPSAGKTILEAIAVSASIMAYSFAVFYRLQADHHISSAQFGASLYSWLILPFGMPVMAGLRAAMIVAREKRERALAEEMSPSELVSQYARFECRTRRRNRIDIGLLLLAAAALVSSQLFLVLPFGAFAWGIAAVYAVSATYLALHGAAPALPRMADFLSLRNAYQYELGRQHQLRSFILWLWPAPVLLAFYASALSAGRTVSVPSMYAAIATAFLCFLVAAANRERNGQVQELTGLLCRMRERRTL
jgi:hypothetical protein